MDPVGINVPADQVKACVAKSRRNPSHLGVLIRSLGVGGTAHVALAALFLDIPENQLRRVLASAPGISPELALKFEVAGRSPADLRTPAGQA